MAFDQYLVGVTALGGVERVEAEVVDDEEVDGEELAQRLLVGVIEPRVLERLEEPVGGEDEEVYPWRNASQPRACARKVLPTPTGPTRTTCAWAATKRRLTSSFQSARS
jgi:hypothetical protein